MLYLVTSFFSAHCSFLSASYDRTLKIWDAETGACTSSLTNGSVAYTGVWHPEDPNTVLAGCGNKRVVQVGLPIQRLENRFYRRLALRCFSIL